MRNIIRFILSVMLIFGLLTNISAQYHKNLVGQQFPKEVLASKLYDNKGDSTTLGQVLEPLKGNIVLIDFWASWCKSCVREAPYTLELQKRYKGKKVAFLFLSGDVDHKKWIRGLATINLKGIHYRIEPESKKVIKDFLKIRGIPYYVLLDMESAIYDPKAKWPHQEKLQNTMDLMIEIFKL